MDERLKFARPRRCLVSVLRFWCRLIYYHLGPFEYLPR